MNNKSIYQEIDKIHVIFFSSIGQQGKNRNYLSVIPNVRWSLCCVGVSVFSGCLYRKTSRPPDLKNPRPQDLKTPRPIQTLKISYETGS
jgi:hypothetical protein